MKFAPTYKYNFNTSIWDTSKKLRHPAWTDRIMFKAKHFSKISIKNYESIPQLKKSDHRPVFAQFLVDIETKPLVISLERRFNVLEIGNPEI